MARVFPLEITATDVVAMLAALDGKTPYTGDDWVTACFDFKAPLAVVCIALPNRVYDAAAHREVAEAIALLPRFHARVARIMAADPDDIDLTGMDIDGDEICLTYCFRYNAQPDFFFSKACHGGPLHPVNFSPQWRTDTAIALARQMDETQDFGAMPILADALQDTGCEQADILNHCRDTNHRHERGCWVVDLVLGRK
jgi:hypothetical protein